MLHPPVESGEYTGAERSRARGRAGSAAVHGARRIVRDKVVAEPFNSTLKTELAYRRFFPTCARARRQIGAWIDQFYKLRRRRSWWRGVRPIRYEQDQQLGRQHDGPVRTLPGDCQLTSTVMLSTGREELLGL